MWRGGRFHKFECHGIGGNLPCLIKSFLYNRHHSVFLNDQSSIWKPKRGEVQQGSVLGVLFKDWSQMLSSLMTVLCYSFLLIVWILSLQYSITNNNLMVMQHWPYQWKCHSTLTKINKCKRSYSLEKPNWQIIRHLIQT